MRLRVDGHDVDVDHGASVLDAARVAGIAVPTVCFDERLSPQGSCRVCLVAVHDDGGAADATRVVAACTTPAAPTMHVRTDDPRARRTAALALELLVSELPDRALDVPAERSELVQACRQLDVASSRFTGARHQRDVDHSHPYVKLDADLCIACGRCVRMCSEVQGTFALSLTARGFDTVVAAGDGGPWASSPCVGCGGCVDTCPTGALSEPGFLDPRPITRSTTTTCGYCGVGCTLDVHVRDDEVAAITPTHGAPVNRGHACVKGRFAHAFAGSGDRLSTPLIRRDGRDSPLEPASWDEAIAVVATRLRTIRDREGPDAIGMISSARATNEENYLAQKFLRTVIGSNSIDNCSRLCHAPSATGLTRSFGLSGGTNRLDDLDHTDCVLLAGANPTEAHPVVGARIKQAVRRGARLIVVDPRRTELARLADVHVQGHAGSNVAIFNGMARILLDEGYTDPEFLRQRATGLAELTALLRDYAPASAAELANVDPATLVAAARLFGKAQHPTIMYGLGVTEHAHGTDGVRSLANLAILAGSVGTPGCCGVLPLRGQNNVQGASDMGALPDLLPGYQHLSDADVRARFDAAWNATIPDRPGLRIPDMFAAAIAGRLHALYVIGEDIAQTDPDSGHVREALRASEFVVCHDVFPSATSAFADVVLPAASFLEKDGTFVNFDRRFQRVRPALRPPGQARSDFDILRLLAAELDADLGCPTPAAALAECAALTPMFAGVSHDRLDRDGPLHWPCRTPDDPGEPVLYLDSFATPDGRAHLAALPYLPPGEPPDAAHPYVLITGRRLEHYNTGSMTRRTANAELLPRDTLDIHQLDAARLHLTDGDLVEVSSRRASITLPARITADGTPGELFTSFHFPDSATNSLTSDATDRDTGCPEYKVTAVALRAPGSA